jgi:hypothetical protein
MHRFGNPKILLAVLVAALALLVPATAGAVEKTGGTAYEAPPKKARVVNGKAIAPSNAPSKVKKIIAAANRIVRKPYRYGGGHGSWEDSGYDCSGTVSYALHGAGLLDSPLDSGSFMRWGKSGKGKWVTIYANGGHAFMVVAGLRLDTGYRTSYAAKWGGKGGSGPRWDKKRSTDGFHVRHPSGL